MFGYNEQFCQSEWSKSPKCYQIYWIDDYEITKNAGLNPFFLFYIEYDHIYGSSDSPTEYVSNIKKCYEGIYFNNVCKMRFGCDVRNSQFDCLVMD